MNATLRSALLVVLALSMSACAVITVDVDVYKGPLANHEAVQVERVAAIAVAAKPLLIYLRDVLESSNPETLAAIRQIQGAGDYQRWLQFARDEKWYKSAYIPGRTDDESRFKDPLADKVNSILSLYEDRGNLYMLTALNQLESQVQAWQGAQQRINSTEAENNDALNKFDPELFAAAIQHPDPLLKALPSEFDEVIKGLKAYIAPVQPFSVTGKSRPAALLEALQELKKKIPDKKKHKEYGLDFELPGTQAYDHANAMFQAMQSSVLLEGIARLVWRTENRELRAAFTNHLREIAVGFTSSRQALCNALRTCFLIDRLNSETEGADAYATSQTEFYENLSQIVCILVGPVAMMEQLEKEEKTDKNEGLYGELINVSGKDGLLPPKWEGKDLEYHAKRQVYEPEVRTYLKEVLKLNPKASINRLRNLHEAIINTGTKEQQYGLSRGPTAEMSAFETIHRNLKTFSTELRGLVRALGLERGRANEGIEGLLERFIRTPSDALGNQKRQRRDELTVALIHFSEKILFLANNEKLLRVPTSASPPFWVPVGWFFGLFIGQKAQLEGGPYVQTLQAIGNSILVQIDELHHRDDFRQKQENRLMVELAALSISSGKVARFAELKEALTQKLPPHDVRKVIDGLLSLLHFEHFQALKSPDSKEPKKADNIAAAIVAAYNYRSSVVYIRPSSAYLRTSYPASTLQEGGATSWQNMLSAHANRTTPFFGQWLAGPSGEYATLKEMDKQYWQSVNRIRLAGGGNTNYVIAKDDIGNWYVKGYSADPEPIIKSMKNLASFAAKAAAGSAGGSGGKPARIEEELDRLQKEYEDQAATDFAALKADADKLDDDVLATWGTSAPKNYTDGLKSAAAILEAEFKLNDESKSPHAVEKVFNGLSALHRFHKDVVAAIKPKEPNSDELLQAVYERTKKTVKEALGKREEALKTYKDRVTVIERLAKD